MIVPVILAGGAGTRLWPLSRELHPKQMLQLTGTQSMLQTTLTRLDGLDGMAPPVVICNEAHRFMIAEQLREIGRRATILLEPVGRNTAPAIAAAALQAAGDASNPDLLVLPADHHIARPEAFHRVVTQGLRLTANAKLVTFGIVPTSPETGYGYIRKGAAHEKGPAFAIDAFVEKPDLETATGYLASGNYLWNSGMFLFRAEAILEEMRRLVPEMVTACEASIQQGRRDLDFFRLEAQTFGTCPADSIDYAVMEKTQRGVVIPLDAGWDDLGSWEALWSVGPKDEQDNVTVGDTLLHDVQRSFVYAGSRLVAALGVDGHIIVETADAVFIAPRERVREVKHLVARLKAAKRPEALVHRRIYRPWGWAESLVVAERYQVRHMLVRPGARISYQKHHHRAEHWVVVRGTAQVQRDQEAFMLKEDESTYIPIGMPHRLKNPGKIPLQIIEVRTGSYLEEDDIERFEDDYGR